VRRLETYSETRIYASALEARRRVAWGRAGDGGPARRPRNPSPAESSAPRQGRRIVVQQAFPGPLRLCNLARTTTRWGEGQIAQSQIASILPAGQAQLRNLRGWRTSPCSGSATPTGFCIEFRLRPRVSLRVAALHPGLRLRHPYGVFVVPGVQQEI
jgi:hypothetical protein